ncbi:MAG TPA: AMP-binding protein [Streptosporangiaceae bacterium]|nr:AMP-binding protein [Streptosporangiaceae bacterium]
METMPVPEWGTIPRMLRDLAARHGDAEVVGGAAPAPLTLAELAARAAEVARGLIALGVRPGDRVAVWAPNTPAWVVTAYGVWDAGAIIAPLSIRFKGAEAARFLREVGAKVLVVAAGEPGADCLRMLTEAGGGPGAGRPCRDLAALEHVISHGPVPPGPGTQAWDDFLAGGAAVATDAAEERALAVDPDDLAEIMATSGTTGTPKGVMLHHAQLLRGYWDWAEIVTLGPRDRYPIIAPFSHGFGLNAGLLACVLKRATMLPIARFAPDELMTMIERERVSVLAGPPTLFFRVLDELGGHDVSSLRVAICGAAAVPPELIRRLLDRVGLERMINAYGLMEGTVVSMTRADDPVEVVAGSAGRAVPGVSIGIVDDDGKELPPGERGEIVIGGYGVMRGYWNDPEQTAAVIDERGRLRTGDIGVLDERGNLTIVDRKKEMFIVGGFNVYPAEVEALLLRHPGLAQAAVVGVPAAGPAAAGRSEAGWAFVVPAPGAAVEPDAVIEWARANMSDYKVPREVIVVDALPANVNGKVDKPALRAMALSGSGGERG